MTLQIRKLVRYTDETYIEGGKFAERPWIMVAVAAVIRNEVRTVRSVAIASRASRLTSASVQPPPTVPRHVPSSRTSILAVSFPGVEPVVPIIVAIAPRSPSSMMRAASR